MNTTRYTAVAILLHWAIALAILANIGIGWWMHEAIEAPQTQARAAAAYQLHKSLGLTVLALSLFRLAWRVSHKTPPLPAATPAWEALAARATHRLFYVLMIVLPLSGWILVSAQWRDGAPLQVPTLWFGLFEVPHLFGLHESDADTRAGVASVALPVHEALVVTTLVLLALHVGAALKHHFHDRDDVATRMLPLLSSRPQENRGRRWILRAGSVAIAAAALAIALALVSGPSGRGSTRTALNEISVTPGSWPIEAEASYIRFAGEHAGTPFQGRFTRWEANIRIDRGNMSGSVIEATVHTGSATDGVTLHDETLPQKEWFDVANHPLARYRATEIEKRDAGGFNVSGVLTIKEQAIQVPALTLTFDDNRATLSGHVVIDRAQADLGMESDPRGRWVSREIIVEVKAVVTAP